jgi:micrococcal nuclease
VTILVSIERLSIGTIVLTAPERVNTETLRVKVLRVFDGDGCLIQVWHPGQQREIEFGARFGFIDAPEMDQPGGKEAKEFLESIIANKWLHLSVLTILETGQVIDRHKRLLCVPYLQDDHGATQSNSPLEIVKALISPWSSGVVMRNIELEMVLNGWAWVVEKYGPDERYLEALDDARRNKRGIWANSDNIAPWHFKQRKSRQTRTESFSGKEPDLFAQPKSDKCPQTGCGGRLVKRNGKFGPFVGCTNFPKCRHTQKQ